MVQGLLEAIALQDATGFKTRYEEDGLHSDPAKRSVAGSIGVMLCRFGLSRRRRLGTLPEVDEREHVLSNIGDSPFGELVVPAVARQLMWWACRDYSVVPFELHNNNGDMSTAIVVGGVILIGNQPDWLTRYKRAMRVVRWRLGYNVEECQEGAVMPIIQIGNVDSRSS